MKVKINKNQKYKAFSFVEVMISVFVAAVGLIAVISLMTGTLNNSIDSRNQVIAALLAQEGAELVRNIRDSNWESENPNGSFDHMANGNDRKIDNNYAYPGDIVSGAPYDLKINAAGFYAHSGITDTKFQRRIVIIDECDGVCGTNPVIGRRITSLVSWNGNIPPAECNTISKCAYSQAVLTTYGE